MKYCQGSRPNSWRRICGTMPAVVVTGARQTGKSTLAEAAAPAHRSVSLDDFDALDAARRQPEALLGAGER